MALFRRRAGITTPVMMGADPPTTTLMMGPTEAINGGPTPTMTRRDGPLPRDTSKVREPRHARAKHTALLVLGCGYTLFFFSETMFWSLWREDENLLVRAVAVLYYSGLGYMMLAMISHFRIHDAWALALAGACFGWVGEGVFAMTLFGVPGIPFPFTVVWTALAWHAPLSVMIGWWALGRALRAAWPWRTLGLAVGLGLFWGAWGYGWRFETPPVVADPGEFLVNAALATALLGLAHWAIGAGRPMAFRSSRIGLGVVGAVTLGYFAVLTIPNVPFAPLVLVPLLGGVWFALRPVDPAQPETILADFAPPIRVRNLLMLALLPFVATATYVVALEHQPDVQTHLVFAVVGGLAGVILFAAALWRVLRRPTHATLGKA